MASWKEHGKWLGLAGLVSLVIFGVSVSLAFSVYSFSTALGWLGLAFIVGVGYLGTAVISSILFPYVTEGRRKRALIPLYGGSCALTVMLVLAWALL